MGAAMISERLFEQFCQESSVRLGRLDVSDMRGLKTPDYEIFTSGSFIFVVVKQLPK